VFYDAASSEQWGEAQTGAFGIIWLPSVAVPIPATVRPISLTLAQAGGPALPALTVTAEDQTITFITRDLQ
jgi:hypothetical protein